jgi:hypothetical protein
MAAVSADAMSVAASTDLPEAAVAADVADTSARWSRD